MKQIIAAFVAGLLLGLGLVVSSMVNPAKVLGFIDITGNWDPSLAFVMGGALVVAAIGYRLVWRRKAPLFEAQFHVPTSREITGSLIIGAVLFGLGWGLVGLCPGPAISAITLGGAKVALFIAMMIAGMLAVRLWQNRKA